MVLQVHVVIHDVIVLLLVSLLLLSGSIYAIEIRIGSRPSPLAIIQAKAVAKVILESSSSSSSLSKNPTRSDVTTTRIVPISASGDCSDAKDGGSIVQDVPLAMRSVDFTGALDDALQSGKIDIAVHSLKDVPPSHRWKNSKGLVLCCPLPREDPADVLVGQYTSFDSIPNGSRIGTSSIRRQAQILSICAAKNKNNIQVVNVRGNLDSRLQALDDGAVDALILASSGLKRLNKISFDTSTYYSRIPTNVMVPGLCQGIVSAVYRDDNKWEFQDWLPNDLDSAIAASVERAFLNSLDESSPWEGRPPLAGLMERQNTNNSDEDGNNNNNIAEVDGCTAASDCCYWTFHGLLARPDGSNVLRTSETISLATADATDHCSTTTTVASNLGQKLGLELLAKAGPRFYDQLKKTHTFYEKTS